MPDGHMLHYSEEDKNLVGFVSLKEDGTVCRIALVLVHGVTGGFMSLSYMEQLLTTGAGKPLQLIPAIWFQKFEK